MKGIGIFLFVLLTIRTSSSRYLEPELNPRIINGSPAFPGQFPWQAALFFSDLLVNMWFCSGTIISQQWILTAGHCIKNAQSVLIYTGIIDISQGINPAATSSDFILHEGFVADTLDNDIAVIRVSTGITFDAKVSTIALSSDPIESGTIITVSGWGTTRGNDTLISPVLNYVNLVTISNEQCQIDYGNTATVLPGMVCADTTPVPLQGPCHGDSGGPVVVDFDTNPKHVAVASFVSDQGCESGFPSGYTRTAVYRDWIRGKTGV